MRDNAVLIFAFAFVLGLVVGAFALLIFPGAFSSLRGLAAVDGEDASSAGPVDAAAGAIAARPAPQPVSGDLAAAPDPALVDALGQTDRAAALDAAADRLDTALFEGDLGTVSGVARALREAAAREREQAVAAAVARAEGGQPDSTGLDEPEEGSLTLLRHRIARRAALRDLRARRNPATELLDRSADPEAVETLVRLVRSAQQSEVRRDAAFVLALGGAERAREVLGEIMRTGGELDDDPSLAASALVLSDDFLALAQLAEAAREELDPGVRLLAVQALGGSGPLARGDAGPVATALAAALRSDTDADVRRAAAAGLAGADLETLDDLRAALLEAMRSDTEADVRLAAVGALLENHGIVRRPVDGAQAALLEVVGQDASPQVRRLAVEALGEIGDASAADALQSVGAGLPPEVAADVPAALERIRARAGDDAGRAPR